MASVLIGMSGGPQQVISGNPWSGSFHPVGGVHFRLSPDASGNVYLGTSGNMTRTSGSFFLSGGGVNDGMVVRPGGEWFVPKTALPISGTFNVYAWWDAACSGQARLFYEPGF